MGTFQDRTDKSILKVFDKYSKPSKLIFTKKTANGDIGSITTSSVTLLVDSFFINPTVEEGMQIVDTYDGQLLLNDIKFDLTTVSFSVGTFAAFESTDTLKINDVTIDMAAIITIDNLIAAINTITNVFCFKLTDSTFVIFSSISDFENDTEYMNLKIEGTCVVLFGLDSNSNKATLKIKINNIYYTVAKIFNGDFVKSLYLKRG